MLKVIVYTNKFQKKSARLVLDLGYRQIVLSWDVNLCAEVLRTSTFDLLLQPDGSIWVEPYK